MVIDNGTCEDSLETTITVFSTQTVSASGNNTICQGESSTLTAATGFTDYTWVSQLNGNTFSDRIITAIEPKLAMHCVALELWTELETEQLPPTWLPDKASCSGANEVVLKPWIISRH